MDELAGVGQRAFAPGMQQCCSFYQQTNTTTFRANTLPSPDHRPSTEKPRIEDERITIMAEYFECYTCEKQFYAGFRARENHCASTGHIAPPHECATCPRWFKSASACNQHMNDKNHFPYECSVCDETWPTEKDCADHEKDEHNYCADCERTFASYNNLQMVCTAGHSRVSPSLPLTPFCLSITRYLLTRPATQHLRSKIHVGENITCPFCKRGFATATGMTHHLEAGSCPRAPQLDRDQIYRLVRSKDPRGTISKNLLGWNGSYKYEATGRAWNGDGYECYLCHREFAKLQGLNQHLGSPIRRCISAASARWLFLYGEVG